MPRHPHFEPHHVDVMKRCPECQTEQTTASPFCENCGYRLRSQATQIEGLPAITLDVLRAERLRRPEQVATEEEEALRPEADQRSPGQEEDEELEQGLPPASMSGEIQARGRHQTEEEPVVSSSPYARDRVATEMQNPAVRAEMRSQPSRTPEPASPPAQDEPAPSPSRTIVEGIQAVAAEPPARQDPAGASASGSFLGPAPPGPSGGGAGFGWGAVLGAGLVCGLLGVGAGWALGAQRGGDASAEAPEAPDPGRVAIAAGTFERGLDEQTRSLLLQTCYKVAEDADERCQQDELLGGEYPIEQVRLEAYAIDRLEVSNARYAECVEAGACEPIDYKSCRVYTHQGFQLALRPPKALKQPSHPAVCVPRAQASDFCEWAGGFLPSADQWERAARGDEDTRLFPWGSTWGPMQANWGEIDIIKTSVLGKVDGHEWTAPVGAFSEGVSPHGLYDMGGNVAEWVAGSGEQGQARGGSWTSDPFDLRVTGRLEVPADKGRTDVGFRCAYDPS